MLKILAEDTYLQEYSQQINNRHEWYLNTLAFIQKEYGSLAKFAHAYQYFGCHVNKETHQLCFREWLPNALNVSLVGDFNNWDKEKTPLDKKEKGIWETLLPENTIPFNSKYKLAIQTPNGKWQYKIPAYCQYVQQNEDHSYDAIYLEPSSYQWKDTSFDLDKDFHPIIYETHIGMATEEYKVGSYHEFTEKVLPYIKEMGYNAIQLMAIQEHPYYGSFGYQVSNFFAPSSRFGMPDDLRKLIDTAHSMGLAVILDVVHSHAVKNELEGLSQMDGTELYFNGNHPDWDSKLFDYGKIEVKQFLLSNIQYWMEEFHFDGFRFDGVTSMMYHHFGHISFDNYSKYFEHTNNDAILYLQLANTLIHQEKKEKISICEDMSGMPGACIPVDEGGLGFDYRLAMGIPDYWMDILENVRDEDWNMGEMYWRLTNRRQGEKNIAYVESHDQALVGDKTTAFWLMDKEMYTHMSIFTESMAIDRGISLHKMIRLATITLGGEGYMTFMGNEFGHPEWVDFPREGNGNSYQYARRQWSLVEDETLKYKDLMAFEKDMISLVKEYHLLDAVYVTQLYENNDEKILVYAKQGLIFLFNFSHESYTHFKFNPINEGDYSILFSSDNPKYGGFDRVNENLKFSTDNKELGFYLPSRSAWVLKPIRK